MTSQAQHTSLSDLTVGQIAATIPGSTTVFRRFNIDFCCHGDVAIDQAAEQSGIDLSDLAMALKELEASENTTPATWDTDDLIDHILSLFHETHRRELPELIALAEKVEAVHCDHPKAPSGLTDLLMQLRGELEVHMKKEEIILFPAMRHRAGGGLDAPIAQMRHDHHDHGELLRRLESLTDRFTLPEEACHTWHALYIGTAKLVNDLMEHIHLENNILFPRFGERPKE